MDKLRYDLNNKIFNEFDIFGQYLRETVIKNVLEYTSFKANLSAVLASMQRQTSLKRDFYLPPYIRPLEVTYCVIALLTLFLICIFLLRFLRRAVNRTFTRYILMSIIAVISASIVPLCIIFIVHFLYGVIYYNYRKEINDNDNFCNSASLPYCNLHLQARSLFHGDLYNNVTASILNYKKQLATRLCGSIHEYSVNPQHILWTKELLSDQSIFFEQIYSSGNMFDAVRHELNLENWYELLNMLNAQSSSPKKGFRGEIFKQRKLQCNLNTIKSYIFEQLYKREIVVSLIKLTQQSTTLRSHLPGNNLTRLIKRVLRESQDLQDFCSVLENSLQEQIENFIELFAREVFAIEPAFKQLPLCKDLKFTSLDISRETYECIEYSLHSFHIGAFGILIILFLILLICLCLVILYEKKGIIGAIRTSSLSRIRSRDTSTAAGNQGEYSTTASSFKGAKNFLRKRPAHVRFQETPTVSGGKHFKRRYFAPEQIESVTMLPKRKRVQVKKRLAKPLRPTTRQRQRRRKLGRYKYLHRKFKGARKNSAK